MKRLLHLALGVVTSIGGFLEVGAIATTAQGGAAFRYQLGWTVLLGTLCLAFLVEMSGRLAAVTKHTVMDAMRARFGLRFSLVAAVTLVIVSLLVMAAEIGGVSLALEYATGIGMRWWGVPVALVVWVLLWKGTFGIVEQGMSLFGLVTLAFIVGAIAMHPPWGAVARGLVPSLPSHEPLDYWLIAVSILGAAISPYLFVFYASGAVEDGWNTSHLRMNRITAWAGMLLGGTLSFAVLVTSAVAFAPRGIRIERYDQVALVLTGVLGHWGFALFLASLAVTCFGAAAQIALASAYTVAQELGWNWSVDVQPRRAARFALTYTIVTLLAAVPTVVGIDPLKLTVMSMVITAATLPVSIVPFLLLMNDERYLGEHTNGWITNSAVLAITALSFVLALVSIPLQVMGG